MTESATTAAWLGAVAVALLIGLMLAPLAPRPSRPEADDDRGHRTRRFVVLSSAARAVASAWSRRSTSARPGPADIAMWVDDLARSVRHGTTLRQTIAEHIPSHPDLHVATDVLRHAIERGRSLADACGDWRERLDQRSGPLIRHLRSVNSVLLVASTAGGGASEPLDRLAAGMRLAAADEMERSAQSAQAAMSARVLTLVPLAVLCLLFAVDDDVRAVVSSATGVLLVGAGVVLNLTGGWWMRRIIAGSAA